jgi:purine-binding chemotaxis protein CheW
LVLQEKGIFMKSSHATETRQYLTFTLDSESFALDIVKVREVLDFTKITRVPRTPEFMKGVINLRGSVVPVIDMRLKFGMEAKEETIDTCIVIVEVEIEGDPLIIGAIADSVQEVMELGPQQIEPPPKLGTRLKTDFIQGMGKLNDKFLIILDISKVFSADELNIVSEYNEEDFEL